MITYTSFAFALGGSEQAINQIGKFDLESYASYVGDTEFSLGKMLFGANGTDFFQSIANFFYGISKWIWQMFDLVIDKLYNGAEMNEAIHNFFQFSKNIYNQLFSAVGMIGIVLTVVYLFYVYLSQPRRAIQLLKRFVFILGFSMIWFGNHGLAPQGENFTKKLDDLSVQVEGFVFQATAGVDQLGQGNVAMSSAQAIKQIREMYFRKTVVDNYLLLNYGTTDQEALKRAKINPSEFLTEKMTKEESEKLVDEVNEKSAEESTYRSYIQPAKGVDKAITGTITPITTFCLGVPIVTIGLIRFVFQLGVLLCLIAIPFITLCSFFPTFEYMIMGFLKKFFGLIFQKSFFSVLILVVFLVFNIIDKWIPTNSLGTLGANIFVKTVISIVAIMKRMVIMEKLGLSSATNTVKTAKNTTKQAWKETKQTVQRANDGLVSARNKVGKAGLAVAGVANPTFGKAMKTARTVQGKAQGFVQAKASQNQAKQSFQKEAKTTQEKKTNIQQAKNTSTKQTQVSPLKQKSLAERTPQTLTHTNVKSSMKERLSLPNRNVPRLQTVGQMISKMPIPLAPFRNKPHYQTSLSAVPKINVRSNAKLNRMPQSLTPKTTLKVSQVRKLQSLRQSKDKVPISVRNAQKPVQVAVNPKFKRDGQALSLPKHSKDKVQVVVNNGQKPVKTMVKQSKMKKQVTNHVHQKRTIQYKGIGGKHR